MEPRRLPVSVLCLTSLVAMAVSLGEPAQAWPAAPAEAPQENKTESLKLLISAQQPSVRSPFPARLTLHLHNAAQAPLWLYRHARDAQAPQRQLTNEEAGSLTTGGSTLAVSFEPEEIQKGISISTLGAGHVLTSVGLPHPKLVRLDPGDDYEEKTVVRLTPAMLGGNNGNQPVWGRYRLSVVYGARYSNAEEIARNLGVTVWQGAVASNAIEVELMPPTPTSQGSVAGTVIRSDGQPLREMLVSLSDDQGRVVDQAITDIEGRFSFTQLPLGLYWATARDPEAATDTAVFRHAELTSAEPAGTAQLVILPRETYEPKQVLHKPVLLRLFDSPGRPLNKAELEITWSSGTVLDKVKAAAADDGTAAVNLIPGRNYVTLRRRGCAKEDQRVDVAGGTGIDGFKLVLDCEAR